MFYRGKRATGNDSKFFSTSKKGENHELREELRSPQRDRKRDAVKKVRVFIKSRRTKGIFTSVMLFLTNR